MSETDCICWHRRARRMLVENCPVHAPPPDPFLAPRMPDRDRQIMSVLMPIEGHITVFFGRAMVDLTIEESRQLAAGLVECLAIADGNHPAQQRVRA